MGKYLEIMFCYAHKDEVLRRGLEKRLLSLKRKSLINIWYDQKVSPGIEWESEIDKHLKTAHIILLLISPAFLNSEYCYSIEMERALERHQRGEVRVIPVILRPTLWQETPLGKLQVLPTSAIPVTDPSWYDLDRAYLDVARGIHKVVEELSAELRTDSEENGEKHYPRIGEFAHGALRDLQAIPVTTPLIGSFATSDPEPWERLFMAQQAPSPSTILNPATLEHFEHLLTISWRLCNENQLATAERVLVSFLPQLLSLSRHEQGTASLASRGLRLQSIFAHHHSRLSDKVRICEQSVNYAREAEDANILVTALIELAWAYKYAGLPDSLQKRLIILQETLDQSRQASPLVQARIYSEYSLVLAERKRIREAELYIELAQEVFPDDPVKDLAFAFADSNMFDVSYCAAFVYIHTGSMTQALPAFERYKQHPSGLIIPERYRLIIANGQSQAAILANDAERYADLLEDVILGSARLGSQKRFDEALAIFRQEMSRSWLLSSRVKQLSEQYGLKREE